MELAAAIIIDSNKLIGAVGGMAQLDDTVTQEEAKLKRLI